MILRGLVVAAMFGVAAPTLALAQQPPKDAHRGPPPPHPGGGGPPPHPGPPPGGPPHPAFKPALVPHGPVGGGPPPGGPPPGFAHPGGPPPGFAHPGGPPPGFAHGPPPGSPQFTYRGRNFNRVHINPFIYPPGWAYREWAVGALLPPLFLTPDYYYPEWAQLGLEPPPPGAQWVRYGPDLLLVDINSGQVLDVAYGVFYDD
jgi:hypothetical protein